MTDISLTQRGNDNGTITFGPTNFANGFAISGLPGPGRNGAPAFDLIERAKEVYDIVRNAQKAA